MDLLDYVKIHIEHAKRRCQPKVFDCVFDGQNLRLKHIYLCNNELRGNKWLRSTTMHFRSNETVKSISEGN